MRTFLLLPIIALFCLFGPNACAQDQQPPPPQQGQPEQLNLPGDNLNLYAVMKIFQESPTLEEFEKKLNDQSLKINNLDLDGDNQIDYIKVVDKVDGDTHNIVLKDAVSKTEDQDVAVFVVKKDRNGQVIIQLIGDEALYGKNYIIEPNTGSSTPTPNPGYTGDQPPPPPVDDGGGAYYAASSWPVVQYMYVPTYSPWSSPWGWGYYPTYWSPWTPFFWHEYYGYQYHWNYYYTAHYRYTPVYRFPAWHDRYYGGGFRSTSVSISVRINQGSYRQTYSRPDLANTGADLFRRDHPGAPHVNRPLPQFDNNNNNRPIVNRNFRNGNDFNNRSANGNNTNRPATRPVDGNTNNNGNNTTPSRPSRQFNARPANTDNTNNNTGNNTRPARQYNNARPADGGNNTTNRPPARQMNNVPQRSATPPPPRPQQQPRPQPSRPPANERPARKE